MVLIDTFSNTFHFGMVWWSWKTPCLTVSPLWWHDSLERSSFLQFSLWQGVVVFEGPFSNSFSFGMVWWSWKNSFLTVSYLGMVWWSWKTPFLTVSPLRGCGGLEITHFSSFFFERVWWSWNSSFLTVSPLRGSGGLAITYFLNFLLLERCGGLERPPF